MSIFKDDNSILWRHIETAVNSIPGKIHKGNEIQFSCNVCGDGSAKKRGYIIWDRSRDVVYYKCFNEGDCVCAGEGNAWPGKRWLKQYYPTIHKSYQREIFGKGKGNSSDNLSNTKITLKSELKAKKELEEKLRIEREIADKAKAEEQEATKHFLPINSDNWISKKAIEICKNRKLPEAVFKRFYVALRGKYTNRLIIPFFDDKGSIYYYQARDLVGFTPKYLNRKTGRDSAIYNFYNIDREKPVMVLEGPIDSMFVENGIAVLGLSITEIVKEKLNKLKCYYLFDDDSAGQKKSIEYLRESKFVFNWKLFKKENHIPDKMKDINDVYLFLELEETMKFKFLSKYFTNSYYHQVYFKF